MMRNTSRRWLAGLLCVVMAASLAVPAMAAMPMMGDGAAVAETPVAEEGHAHIHSVAERPAVSEEDVPATLSTATSQVHNFTTSGKTSDFYTITGNLSTSKGTVTYNGLTLTQCLKLESATKITFTAPAAGELILVFVEPAGTIQVDGTKKTATSGVIKESLAAGAHTLAKADTANLFYMSFSGTVAAHTHSYGAYEVTTPATCTEPGVETATCTVQGCGETQTRTIQATGHSFKNGNSGICQSCAWDTTQNAYHTHSWGSWTQVPGKAAACDKEGEESRTCQTADCGKVETQPIPKTAHNYVNDVCTVCNTPKPVGSFTKVGGHLETAYAQWPILTGVDQYKVYVKTVGGAYKPLDDKLIRRYPTYMRADAVGLAAGTYVLKVECLAGGAVQTSFESSSITVKAHDRSGFAHMDGHVPGAYNMDGTLKTDAEIIYVTNDTKDTVEWKGFKGIQAIMTALKKNATGPVCVRFIGNITDPATLTDGDLEIKEFTKGLTLEGIGNDATINGWGIVPKICVDVEVRNLGFMNCNSAEGDSLSFDGAKNGGSHLWTHNNDIFYGDAGSDADQAKGDGALDTKKSLYVTHSYNHFWDSGKSNLVGMHEGESMLNWLTFHHNWYDHSDSRHPRVRGASVHVYNNYFDGLAKYGAGATEASSLFVENNYYRNVTKPLLTAGQGTDIVGSAKGTFSGEDGGMIKAFGNAYVMENRTLTYIPYNASSASVEFDAYEAAARNEKVPSTVKAKKGGATYNNFDTDSTKMYAYTPDNAKDVPALVTAYAGRVEGGDFTWDIVASFTSTKEADENYGVITALKNKLVSYKGTLVSVGGTVGTSSGSGSGSGGGSETPPACTTHDWRWTITTAATCGAPGVKTATCFLCGATNPTTETIPATGKHSFVNGTCTGCGAAQGTVPDPGPVDPGDSDKTKTYTLTGDEAFGKLTPNGKDTSSTPHDIYNFATGEKLEKQGTEGFFTVYSNAGKASKLDYSKKIVQDYTGTYRFNFGGSVTILDADNKPKLGSAIGFTTTGPATVKVWWIAGGADRPMGIYQGSSNTPVQTGTKTGAQDTALVESFTLTGAGTYYLGSTASNNNIFKVEVTVTEAEVIEPDVEFRGVMVGERDLYYSWWEDENLIIEEMVEGDRVLAALYDADGVLITVKSITYDANTVEIPGSTPKLKLFWLDQKLKPLSPAATVWGGAEEDAEE